MQPRDGIQNQAPESALFPFRSPDLLTLSRCCLPLQSSIRCRSRWNDKDAHPNLRTLTKPRATDFRSILRVGLRSSMSSPCEVTVIRVFQYLLTISLFAILTFGQDTSPKQSNEANVSWSVVSHSDLSIPGSNTLTLGACSLGVRGDEPFYFFNIFDGNQSEVVRVEGGNCRGDGNPGTLQFTTRQIHRVGFKVGSATAGIQELIIASRFTPKNPNGVEQGGKVVAPVGEFEALAPISIRSSGMTVDFSGAIIDCHMQQACIFVGDPSNSTLFSNITLINPRGRPTVDGGQAPFIEVNAQGTRIFNVSTRVHSANGTFGTLLQIDDDQAFLLDGLTTHLGGSGVRCDASVCNPVIYAPGPFNKFSAVGWLKNLNISLGCNGNGIDWQSGNTLRISDSVVQGYSQYGVRAGTRRGGYGGFALENVYEEVGKCTNPLGNIGVAGVVAEGAGVFGVKIEGGVGPAGKIPQFAKTGSTDYRYYVVAHHPAFGSSNPLYAGNALTNGSGNIVVTTPDITGASTLDLLRTTVVFDTLNQAPFGTNRYAVAINVNRSSACVRGVCTFVDAQSPLQTYTVGTPTYFPMIEFWPAALVLGSNADTRSVYSPARAYLDNAFDSIVSVLGSAAPAVVANRCDPSDKWTPTWISCFSTAPPSSFHEQGGFLLMAKPNHDGGKPLNLKGRLNFAEIGTGPGHVITISDSNFSKTIATANNRPTSDPDDAFIGFDQANGDPHEVGISFGAPKSLTNYIGNNGDGKHWLERLTANVKTFNIPVSAASYRTTSNCASPSGSCGSASAGRVTIARGQSRVTVTTSAVSSESEIHIDENFSYGPSLHVTCDRTVMRRYVVAEQANGRFVVETDKAPVRDPACLSFSITN